MSEAYYGLQRADQLVRIREADLRNDLVILNDVLALKQAGLVPRLDLLRRRAIEADGEELLIQAQADQAIARRRLALLLNLPPNLTPTASDPIVLQPRWPSIWRPACWPPTRATPNWRRCWRCGRPWPTRRMPKRLSCCRG